MKSTVVEAISWYLASVADREPMACVLALHEIKLIISHVHCKTSCWSTIISRTYLMGITKSTKASEMSVSKMKAKIESVL